MRPSPFKPTKPKPCHECEASRSQTSELLSRVEILEGQRTLAVLEGNKYRCEAEILRFDNAKLREEIQRCRPCDPEPCEPECCEPVCDPECCDTGCGCRSFADLLATLPPGFKITITAPGGDC